MYGFPPGETEGHSPRELLSFLKGKQKKEQQERRQQAQMLYIHAGLCARAVTGGKMPDLWEAFPLWSRKEVYMMRAERAKSSMYRHVKALEGGEKG